MQLELQLLKIIRFTLELLTILLLQQFKIRLQALLGQLVYLVMQKKEMIKKR